VLRSLKQCASKASHILTVADCVPAVIACSVMIREKLKRILGQRTADHPSPTPTAYAYPDPHFS
jgi:hypothetical protein